VRCPALVATPSWSTKLVHVSALTLPSLFASGRVAQSGGPLLEIPANDSVSPDTLWASVAQAANALVASGLAPGDRLLIQAEKSVNVLVTYLACVHAGIVFLPLNSAYTDTEVQWIVDDAAPSLVVRAPDRALLVGPHRTLGLDADGAGSLADLFTTGSADRVALDQNDLRADDLAALVYTSGTTGRPKGAMLTQANLASNARTLIEAWSISSADRLLHVLPIFHAHGLFVAVNTVLGSGASMIWLPRFDPDAVFDALARATVFMGVPTHYSRLLDDDRLDRSSTAAMRLWVSGSAPLLAATHDAFAFRTGHRILERYGMTETVMLTSNPLDGERRAGTVGPALAGVDVRIVDESGATVADGTVGAVEVRGPSVFSGYWGRPDLTASEFTTEGFFRTGDVGQLEDGGYLRLVGRAKDLVITGGLNVYPIEVEETVDAFAGVLESAVIGVPDADFGEAVVAVVVAEPGVQLDPTALREYARRTLAGFKVPKRIHVVDALPRNAMGKVEKAKLRTLFAQAVDAPEVVAEPRVAIVTGAGSGVGAATAVRLLHDGWRVVLVGRRPDALAATAAGHGLATVHPVDLRNTDDAMAIVDHTIIAFGRLDALINNAGDAHTIPIDETTPERFADTFAVNVFAPAAMIHRSWSALARSRGVIVNVSSMASIDPFDGFFAYGSSKAALNALTVSAANEGAPIGIRAFTVSPGVIDTPMHARLVDPSLFPPDTKLSADTVASVIVDCCRGDHDGQEGRVLAVIPPAARARLHAWIEANPTGRVVEVRPSSSDSEATTA
jgi:malonyl-CoA/methylmalonyl-CoA synthetase